MSQNSDEATSGAPGILKPLLSILFLGVLTLNGLLFFYAFQIVSTSMAEAKAGDAGKAEMIERPLGPPAKIVPPPPPEPPVPLVKVKVSEEINTMLASNGCIACHAVQKDPSPSAPLKVGPPYLEVAKRYAGKADALATLTNKVWEGGTGNWGQIPMPPHKLMGKKKADIEKLVAWILEIKAE